MTSLKEVKAVMVQADCFNFFLKRRKIMISILKIAVPIIDLVKMFLFALMIYSLISLFLNQDPITLGSFTATFAYLLAWISARKLNLILAKELYKLMVTRNNRG